MRWAMSEWRWHGDEYVHEQPHAGGATLGRRRATEAGNEGGHGGSFKADDMMSISYVETDS